MTRRLAFAIVFLGLATCASAQQCEDCVDEKPQCPQGQEPTCQGGEWICPEPLCGDYERRICEDEYCGVFDDFTCVCNVDEGGCGGGCNPSDRDRCYEECGYSPYCWDEELCYCYAYPDVQRPQLQSRAGRVFLGTFPPRMTSCAEKIPTSLAITMSEPRIHTGGPVTDYHGNVLAAQAWGVSAVVKWAVLDQDTALLDEDGMLASEYLDHIAGLQPSVNLNGTVGVGDNGEFYDVYALLTSDPAGLQPGDYSVSRQRIEIRKRGSNQRYEVENHCIKFTHNNVQHHAPCH